MNAGHLELEARTEFKRQNSVPANLQRHRPQAPEFLQFNQWNSEMPTEVRTTKLESFQAPQRDKKVYIFVPVAAGSCSHKPRPLWCLIKIFTQKRLASPDYPTTPSISSVVSLEELTTPGPSQFSGRRFWTKIHKFHLTDGVLREFRGAGALDRRKDSPHRPHIKSAFRARHFRYPLEEPRITGASFRDHTSTLVPLQPVIYLKKDLSKPILRPHNLSPCPIRILLSTGFMIVFSHIRTGAPKRRWELNIRTYPDRFSGDESPQEDGLIMEIQTESFGPIPSKCIAHSDKQYAFQVQFRFPPRQLQVILQLFNTSTVVVLYTTLLGRITSSLQVLRIHFMLKGWVQFWVDQHMLIQHRTGESMAVQVRAELPHQAIKAVHLSRLACDSLESLDESYKWIWYGAAVGTILFYQDYPTTSEASERRIYGHTDSTGGFHTFSTSNNSTSAYRKYFKYSNVLLVSRWSLTQSNVWDPLRFRILDQTTPYQCSTTPKLWPIVSSISSSTSIFALLHPGFRLRFQPRTSTYLHTSLNQRANCIQIYFQLILGLHHSLRSHGVEFRNDSARIAGRIQIRVKWNSFQVEFSSISIQFAFSTPPNR
ncbi:hypothetical protein C8R43DRAFT_1111140 [Mycena crocata]|nr:hypothetical protein C8R43DRAFT_1111140 [Mycena crocata]